MKKSNFVALILGTVGIVFLHWECAWHWLKSGECSRKAS